MVLRPLGHRNGDDNWTVRAFFAHVLHLHVDITVVLVKLLNAIEILRQLRLVQSPRFIQERDHCFAARLHLFAQDGIAEMSVPFEKNTSHRALSTFIYCVDDARRPAPLVNRVDPKLYGHVVEATPLIRIDDILTPFLQLFLIDRRIDFEGDLFPQPFRVDRLGSVDFNLAHDRTCLHRHDDLNAVAFRLGKNSDIPNCASRIELPDVLFHHRI